MEQKRPVIILHGYSDHATSFEKLANYLKANGFNVIPIWLSDYKSMNDEITIQDLGEAMGRALAKENIPVERHSFDLICHSTGGLVVRAYLQHYFYGKPNLCPIKHLVMLAPANFGSPLATLGKSMLGRLTKGWDWDHFFETGKEILSSLELASPISWRLAERDLFDLDNAIFKKCNLYTTILIGSDAYDGKESIMHENGSDGTVRVSTANLNANAYRLKFSELGQPIIEEIKRCYNPIAFGVLFKKNHGSIIHPEGGDPELGELIISSLSIESDDVYDQHVRELSKITDTTFTKGINESEDKVKERYHNYQTVVTRVHDQFGNWIGDYFLEFFQESDSPEDETMQTMHKEVLEKVTKNETNPSYRSFHFDLTDLDRLILQNNKQVDMSISVAALSRRIFYRNPKGFAALTTKIKTFFKPHEVLLLDIQVNRAQSDDVFQFIKG